MKSSANSSQTKANRSYDARRRAERSKRRLGLESLEGRALMAGDTAAWNQGLTYEQGPWLTEFAPGDEYWIHYRLNQTQLIGSTPPQDHLMTWGMYLSPDAAVDMRDRKIFEDGENAQLAVVDSGFPDYKLPGAEDSFWNNVQPDAQGKAQIWLNFYLKDTQTGAIAWGKPWAMDVVLDKPDILMHSFTASGDTMRFEYEVRGERCPKASSRSAWSARRTTVTVRRTKTPTYSLRKFGFMARSPRREGIPSRIRSDQDLALWRCLAMVRPR
jgi:hypothetical protein